MNENSDGILALTEAVGPWHKGRIISDLDDEELLDELHALQDDGMRRYLRSWWNENVTAEDVVRDWEELKDSLQATSPLTDVGQEGAWDSVARWAHGTEYQLLWAEAMTRDIWQRVRM